MKDDDDGNDEMTLVADRFIRFDDGTVRDLATGERVTLIERTLPTAAEQVARRDQCLAMLDAQARAARRAPPWDALETFEELAPFEPQEECALVDFALIGESLWIEAYRMTKKDARSGWRDDATDGSAAVAALRPDDTILGSATIGADVTVEGFATARDEGLRIAPAVDAIAATLDSFAAGDVHRLYVKAPDHARLDPLHAIVAREARARGFIPLSSAVVSTWPAIAPLLTARSIVLFGDARCVFSSFSGAPGISGPGDAGGAIARAIALLYRKACVVTAIVARVCNHVSVAALRLIPAPATGRRAASAWRPGSVLGVSEADAPPRVYGDHANAAWPPESVVQPAVDVSYDDPNLPSLFPRTDQIAQVAEMSTFTPFVFKASNGAAGTPSRVGWQSIITLTGDAAIAGNGAAIAGKNGRTNGAAGAAPLAVIDAVIGTIEGAADGAIGRDDDGTSTLRRFSSSDRNSMPTPEPEAVILAVHSDLGTASKPNTASNTETASNTGTASSPETNSSLKATSDADVGRYPPLRLVSRRTISQPVERGPIEVPVVTTMVSGYGDAVDVLVSRGRWAAALRTLRAEVAAHERRKNRYDAARTSIALGRLHLAIGEIGPAARCFDRAGELACSLASGPVSRSKSDSNFDRVGYNRLDCDGLDYDCSLYGGRGYRGAGYGGPDYAGPGYAGPGDGCPDHPVVDYGNFDDGGLDDGVLDYGVARLIGEALRWSGIAALEAAELERSERLLRSALAAIGPEADPHQVFAIELSLARCLFWQGRGREVVLPSLDVLTPSLWSPAPSDPFAPSDERHEYHDDADAPPGTAPGAGTTRTTGAGQGSWTSVSVLASRFKRRGLTLVTPEHVVFGRTAPASSASVHHDALATAILGVERWRRAARIALAEGDVSTAGDAIARACRIARGEDEDDGRSLGCQPVARPRRASSARTGARVGANARPDIAPNEQRIRDALRAACHLDASRLQFAIGDTTSGDAHLKEGLALSRAPARIARVQLLQLARFRNIRTSEARRRFERLSAALRQPRVPKLVRIQARYLIDPRSRRAMELVTFLDRHGDTALAGYGRAHRGGSPMLEAFQDVLRICHETPDDLTALTQVSAYLRDQLRATSVAIYGAPPSTAAPPGNLVPLGNDVQPRSIVPSGSVAPAGNVVATREGRGAVAAPGSVKPSRDVVPPGNLAPLGNVVQRRSIGEPDNVAPPGNVVATREGPGAVTAPVPVPADADGGARLVSEGAFEADPEHERASSENTSGGGATAAGGAVVVRYAVAGSTRLLSPELAARAIDSGLLIPPTYRPDALDAAAPVRYGGAPIGAIVVRWSIDAAIDHTTASALISAAAAAVSPHLRAALDREQPETGPGSAAADSPASARTRTLGLLGISSAIDTLRQTITRVASAPFHVLIEGESGSGKELVARALHQRGPRRHRRFCAVNCAAFTDELLEAELFGHTRGAFTGALTERAGLFEDADGGTLFLDEIGELSPRGQAKLLRVIQDGETRRIGENLPRRVDTRIVAATNRSLRDEADAGQFRADLLYRLDVIRITVPPLRARAEDVPVLARAFWEEAIARLGSRATLDPATLTALARYHWPGNVRELHNAIMALAVHAPPRGRVTPSMLPASIRAPAAVDDDAADRENVGHENAGRAKAGRAKAGRAKAAKPGASDGSQAVPVDGHGAGELPFEGPLEDARRAFESRYIRAALARAGGSPSRAAHSLGLTRQGLQKLMARLGIENDERRASSKRTSARKERPPP